MASWREASGREEGGDGYQIGDLTRSLFTRRKGTECSGQRADVAASTVYPVAGLDIDDEDASGVPSPAPEPRLALDSGTGPSTGHVPGEAAGYASLAGGETDASHADCQAEPTRLGAVANEAEKYSVVQRLVHDAVAVYRARGVRPARLEPTARDGWVGQRGSNPSAV